MKKRLTKKNIAKIQLWLGVALLIFTIISSIFIVKEMYIGTLETGLIGVTGTWSDVINDYYEIEGIDPFDAPQISHPEIAGFVVNNITLQGMIVKTTVIIFLATALILVILAIMLILQGSSNLAKK
jgi:hypothetical protein